MGCGEKVICVIEFGSGAESKLRDALSGHGCSVRYFHGDEEPFRRMGDHSPSLVLVGLGPLGHGEEEAWERIATIARESDVPVALVSSYPEAGRYIRAIQAGVSHHISLPCTRGHLLSRVDEIMALGGLPDRRADTFQIEIEYGAQRFTIDASRPMLYNLMRSAVANAVEKDGLLLEILKKHFHFRSDIIGEELYRGPVFESEEEKALYGELIAAFRLGEFRLRYQPIVSIPDGRVSGFEALIRWENPRRGTVPPDDFIPLAEKTDLIIPLGSWVMEEASRQLREWQELFPSDAPLTMSINISARQFVHGELIERIDETVARHGLDPSTVRLEITESAFMEDMDSANMMLLALKSKNFMLYMDDFGTGYSSLRYLMHFPVDVLKIDKSFVRWMHVDEESEEIVRSVIALAHNLKRKVIAEGVETEAHLNKLRELGCDFAQGYYFSAPLDAPAASRLLAGKPARGEKIAHEPLLP